jgi:hypothetical protein
MKNSRALPIPFLILILAGVISLFSILADAGARAGGTNDDSVRIQIVEQERMAAMYLRVLSWISGVTAPRQAQPAAVNQPSSPAPHAVKAVHRPACASRVELCSLAVARNLSGTKHPRQTLN